MTVPERLARILIGAGEKYRDDMFSLNFRMAVCIIHYYLGKEWYDLKIRPQNVFDPFMLNGRERKGDAEWNYLLRVIRLGDSLFQLRDCQNFSTLCDRFRARVTDTKACFTEAQIASDFSARGFPVKITEESGVRGTDFDFMLQAGKQDISVEVTTKNPSSLSAETIKNTLNNKRSQVPSERAAMLFIVIPEEWTADTKSGDSTFSGAFSEAAESIFSEAFNEFYRGSKRFNSVYLVWTTTIISGGKRAFVETYRPYENPSPRHPIEDGSLFRSNALSTLDDIRQRAEAYFNSTDVSRDSDFDPIPTSFYHWYRRVRQQG